ncbi:MAG: sodium:alanine symporter family protein [Oscillospiraceae bacterium]|nr:sodium:alanine symporter family protein [Oscillospiraceae bacterium]
MTDFAKIIADINSAVNSVVWGVPALVLLIGTGVLMTVLTKFFQFTRFGHMWKTTIGAMFKNKHITKSADKQSISQFQALCTALSATIGTGNIAGVAYAITMGGPGSIFWMWIAAIVGMMTNYSENLLGIYFRRRNEKGEWSGGAMYYLRDGVGSMKYGKVAGPVLAVLFSVFATLASFGIGNMGQFVSISESITTLVPSVPSGTLALIVGAVVLVFAALVIIGGLKRIATTNERIVPFMALFYMLGSIIIIIMNYQNILPAFGAIFAGAFNFKSAAGGIGGAVIAQAMTWGFKRGVFSNEAGLGSSVMVHSASNVKEPVVQGLWGIFEVFADTILVCTCTALVILTSGVVDMTTGASVSGVTKLGLATEAFTKAFGPFGGIFIAVAVCLFAFTTILGWSYYGTKSWEYLFGTKSTIVYKILFLAMIMVSATIDASLAIDISDTMNGLMAIPNLIGVISLSWLVVKVTKNYTDRKITRKNPHLTPMYSHFDDIQREMEKRKDQ